MDNYALMSDYSGKIATYALYRISTILFCCFWEKLDWALNHHFLYNPIVVLYLQVDIALFFNILAPKIKKRVICNLNYYNKKATLFGIRIRLCMVHQKNDSVGCYFLFIDLVFLFNSIVSCFDIKDCAGGRLTFSAETL